MEQEMEPPAPAPPPAAAVEQRALPQPQQQQPKPAVLVQPAMPVPSSWPVAFTPMKPMVEVKSCTQTKRKKHCNCKNSHCLKLYCECFAAGVYCFKIRQEASNNIKQRNRNAFEPKIENVPNNASVQKDDAGAAPSVPKHKIKVGTARNTV